MSRHACSVIFGVIFLASCVCHAQHFSIYPGLNAPKVVKDAATEVTHILEENFVGAVLDEAPDPVFESTTFIPVIIIFKEVSGMQGLSGRPAYFEFDRRGNTNCPDLPADVQYPLALANQIVGRDIGLAFHNDPTTIYIEYPPGYWSDANARYWARTKGVCPASQTDLVSALLHEALHGMGFADVVDVTTGVSGVCSDGWYRPAKFSSDGHVKIDDEYWFSARGVFNAFNELVNAEQRNIGLGGRAPIQFTGAKTLALLGYVQYPPALYNPNPAESGRTLVHWESQTINGAYQVMYRAIQPGAMTRSLGVARGVMMDLGWKLKSRVVVPKTTDLGTEGENSNKSLTDTAVQVIVSNNTESAQTVNSIALTGQNADQFQIVQGGGVTSLAAWEEHLILVAHAPTTTGLHTAQLQVTLTDTVNGTSTLISSFTGYGIETDSDGDGMSDEDETRDLLLDVEGINNPFNSGDDDSTGDDESVVSDDLPDGQNDYDGDGMSNEMEFFFGYNPVDPLSVGYCTEWDTDGDGLSDAFERRYNTPFNPYDADSSGDDEITDPDGIPDGFNNFDGDDFSNNYEMRWGSDPTDENSVPPTVPASGVWAVSLAAALITLLGLRELRRNRSSMR